MEFINAAMEAVAVGLKVFPLQSGAKVPIKGSRGCLEATDDDDQITRWAHQYPDANLGVATGRDSGFIVIDVDVKGDADGLSTLRIFTAEGHELPKHNVGSTPSGGFHIPVKYTELISTNSAGKLGPGLDIRSNGGYVLWPPSVLPNGKYYWRNFSAIWDPCPLWVVEKLGAREDEQEAKREYFDTSKCLPSIKGLIKNVDEAQKGERNTRLFWSLCRAAEQGMNAEPILEAARRIKIPPSEIETCLKQARKYNS